MSTPQPPPEAVVLRLARKAAGRRSPEVARAAGISKARLSQIENGYETRFGQRRPVQGKDGTIAHLAATLGVGPERLEEAGRPDAAAVLREMLRNPPVPEPAPRPMTDVMVWVAARMRDQGRPLDETETLFRQLGWNRDARMKAPADITAREARIIAAELGVNAREVYEQLGLLDAGDLDARGPQPPAARSRPEDEQWGNQARKA